MRAKFGWTICAILAAVSAVSSHAQQALGIQMRLSKTIVMLGEPVWVDVTVTNRSADFLMVEMGTNCPGDGSLTMAIPGAEPGRRQMEHRCYWGSAGSCSWPGPSLLAPGDSLQKRHVLAGDFRITHPGHYTIQLKSDIGYATAPNGEKRPELMRDALSQTTTGEISLDVRDADPVQLLRLEQGMAAEYAKEIPQKLEPVTSPASLKNDSATQRSRDLQDAHRLEAFDAKSMLAAGLAEYPVAGMEPVFDDWLTDSNVAGYYGLRALYLLNTAEARAMLARVAEGSSDLYERWGKNVHGASPDPDQAQKLKQEAFANWRSSAVHALARMGDPSYAPLIEKLTSDPRSIVRQEAILDLGLLGGNHELPKLMGIIRNDPDTNDRLNAITAMGDTQSLKAVPLLIQLFSLSDALRPTFTNLALTTLTHHFVRYDEQRTAAEYQAIWQQWWEQNRSTAQAYGPFECATDRNAQ